MLNHIAGMSGVQIELLAAFLLLEGVALAAVPEEIILLSLGVLWGQGRVGFFGSLLAAQVGLLSANVIMVLIGKKAGRRVLSIPPFSWVVKRELLEKALAHLKRHGKTTIVVTRFTPVIRGPVYLAVGISPVSAWTFLRFDYLASLVHIPLLFILGRFIGRAVGLEAVYRGIVIAAAGGFAVSGALVLLDMLKRARPARGISKDS